jgi:Holliday junction resolvase RusA-like endonuclease
MTPLTFFVSGTPIPKGSAKAFAFKQKGTGKLRTIVTQTNNEKQKPWASSVSFAAEMMMKLEDRPLIGGPIALGLTFIMPRPKAHYRTGKNSHLLRDDAPTWHTSTPDLDKLVRSVGDALTGRVWKDDSQVCILSPPPSKKYGDRPGVHITIIELK